MDKCIECGNDLCVCGACWSCDGECDCNPWDIDGYEDDE